MLACAALIFAGSTDLLSSQHTSRLIGPILRWFQPDVSADTIRQVQIVVRKIGHLTENAILAMLVWRALRKPVRHDPRPWSWRTAVLSVVLTGAYAITDEWHQSFVNSRYASAADVLIDTIGAIAGVLGLWAIGRWRRRW